jgi:membrane-bound ClpP family serine protease
MEPIQAFLLNPNTVYLILVFGILLTIMALISPGTTILELLAFFTLLLAGYGIYNLSVNVWALVILLLGVILFVLAVRRFRQPVFLVLSIIFLIIGSVYIFPGETWWQPGVNPLLATVVSLLVAGYMWVIATKAMEVFIKKVQFRWTVNFGALPVMILSVRALWFALLGEKDLSCT